MPNETTEDVVAFGLGQTLHTIRLKRRGSELRWWREDGEAVSPTFTSLYAAINFPDRNPFLTDKEWEEFNPQPDKKLDELEIY